MVGFNLKERFFFAFRLFSEPLSYQETEEKPITFKDNAFVKCR